VLGLLNGSAYVSAGVELSGLLSGRADATGNRTDAASLRGDAMSEVRVLRELLAKALRRTPDGGRAVDHRLFHYLDTLAAMRAGGSASPTPPAPADPPPA